MPFLSFNLAETTLGWPPQGEGEAQQKPNSGKLMRWKQNMKKMQHRESDKKSSVLEIGTAKTNLAESSHGSVSDCRRPPIKVGGPRSYGWKDIWLAKF